MTNESYCELREWMTKILEEWELNLRMYGLSYIGEEFETEEKILLDPKTEWDPEHYYASTIYKIKPAYVAHISHEFGYHYASVLIKITNNKYGRQCSRFATAGRNNWIEDNVCEILYQMQKDEKLQMKKIINSFYNGSKRIYGMDIDQIKVLHQEYRKPIITDLGEGGHVYCGVDLGSSDSNKNACYINAKNLLPGEISLNPKETAIEMVKVKARPLLPFPAPEVYPITAEDINNVTDAYGRYFKELGQRFTAGIRSAMTGVNSIIKLKEDTEMGDLRYKKIIFNYPATIVLWQDGTKTVVKVKDGETWDPEKGVAMCFMKKAMGNTGSYNKIIKKAISENGANAYPISRFEVIGNDER